MTASPARVVLPGEETQLRWVSGVTGTASQLRGLASPPYKAIYKTGTIEERVGGRRSETLLLVVGLWDENAGSFVPGRTLSCFLYMQEAKAPHGDMTKFELARPVVEILLAFLQEKGSTTLRSHG